MRLAQRKRNISATARRATRGGGLQGAPGIPSVPRLSARHRAGRIRLSRGWCARDEAVAKGGVSGTVSREWADPKMGRGQRRSRGEDMTRGRLAEGRANPDARQTPSICGVALTNSRLPTQTRGPDQTMGSPIRPLFHVQG